VRHADVQPLRLRTVDELELATRIGRATIVAPVDFRWRIFGPGAGRHLRLDEVVDPRAPATQLLSGSSTNLNRDRPEQLARLLDHLLAVTEVTGFVIGHCQCGSAPRGRA